MTTLKKKAVYEWVLLLILMPITLMATENEQKYRLSVLSVIPQEQLLIGYEGAFGYFDPYAENPYMSTGGIIVSMAAKEEAERLKVKARELESFLPEGYMEESIRQAMREAFESLSWAEIEKYIDSNDREDASIKGIKRWVKDTNADFFILSKVSYGVPGFYNVVFIKNDFMLFSKASFERFVQLETKNLKFIRGAISKTVLSHSNQVPIDHRRLSRSERKEAERELELEYQDLMSKAKPSEKKDLRNRLKVEKVKLGKKYFPVEGSNYKGVLWFGDDGDKLFRSSVDESITAFSLSFQKEFMNINLER